MSQGVLGPLNAVPALWGSVCLSLLGRTTHSQTDPQHCCRLPRGGASQGRLAQGGADQGGAEEGVLFLLVGEALGVSTLLRSEGM